VTKQPCRTRIRLARKAHSIELRQSYAHLRQQQEGSLPVVAAIILYLNELFPSVGDIKNFVAR
jgi:hypothetical protein